jgi:hypothetical protein
MVTYALLDYVRLRQATARSRHWFDAVFPALFAVEVWASLVLRNKSDRLMPFQAYIDNIKAPALGACHFSAFALPDFANSFIVRDSLAARTRGMSRHVEN